MNRTIKFRGKRLKIDDPLERWIDGALCTYKDIRDTERCHVVSQSGYHNDVAPATIGQFTGLLDKNGKEIYEGDIVRYYDDIEDELVSGYVIYHKESCSFCIVPAKLCGDYIGLNVYWQFEVIGNIYDNPELLKGGEE